MPTARRWCDRRLRSSRRERRATRSSSKLPGWIDEGSVRVTLSPASAGKILDVQVRRTFLAKPTDEEFIKAEIAVRELADQTAEFDDEKAVLDA